MMYLKWGQNLEYYCINFLRRIHYLWSSWTAEKI